MVLREFAEIQSADRKHDALVERSTNSARTWLYQHSPCVVICHHNRQIYLYRKFSQNVNFVLFSVDCIDVMATPLNVTGL
jgi:hypothetical protein